MRSSGLPLVATYPFEYTEEEVVLRGAEQHNERARRRETTRTPASGTNRPQTMQSTTCVFAGTFWNRCWKSQRKGSDAINEPTCEKLAWLCRFFVSTQYSSQSCSSLVAAMFFVTAFIWFEPPVWSCNAWFFLFARAVYLSSFPV